MENRNIKKNLILIIILQVCGILLLPIWFIFAAMSFMAFDSGYSSEALIVVCLIFSIVAWVLYRKGKFKSSIITMAIPLIYAFIYSLIFSIIAKM